MKLAILSSVLGVTCAFAPVSQNAQRFTALRLSETEKAEAESSATSETPFFASSSAVREEETDFPAFPNLQSAPVSAVAAVNGWSPDDSKPCFGLPGVVAPTGYFDPLGFCQKGISLNDVKRYREAEVHHGRVAMLAAVGYLAGEAISGPFNTVGPANDQLQQTPAPAFALLTVFVAANELRRASIGWVEPSFKIGSKTLWTLRDTYYPGDIGFDPLGLKPSEAKPFANMQTKELQNGRLAMLGWAGMCSQELVNHKTVLATFDFYQKVYSGINPYDVA